MSEIPRQTELSTEDLSAIQAFGITANKIREELGKRIVALDSVIEQLLICLMSGSHALLVGVPGLAKTLLISSLAEIMSLDFSRIQFTPDLMPSDITGTELIAKDPKTGERVFHFAKGPLFAHLLLADEINRTPPKTQAALMEAMEEHQVTSGGKRHVLDPPFYVLATQNPIEQEGTYPLPVAQLDRFMFEIEVDYPSFEEEYKIATLTTSGYTSSLEKLVTRDEILHLMDLARRIPVDDATIRYATAFGRLSRPDEEEAPDYIKEWLAWGGGPRAAQNLLKAAKGRAILNGRAKALPEDVRAAVHPVLRHRFILNYHAEAEGVTVNDVTNRLLETIPAPDGWKPAKDGPKEAGFFDWFRRWFRQAG